MIEGLKLKFGSAPGRPPIEIEKPAVTVFVGPNNSGKSLLLREILNVCHGGRMQTTQILGELEFECLTDEEIEAEIAGLQTELLPGERNSPGQIYLAVNGRRFQVHRGHYEQARRAPNSPDHRSTHFSSYFAQYQTLNLDGASRIRLVDEQEKGDLKNPSGSFARLLTDDPRREALRAVIFDAVNMYLGIDMSEGNMLKLRFGTTPPINERTVEDATLDWMRAAKSTADVSDGIRAFAGILVQLRAGNPRIVLIDEPEAFLHPALAFKLGKEVAKTATEVGKHLFAATHSPQFLMGVIHSGARVNIVRLTHYGGMGTARLLPTAELTSMMRDPYLRSANIMSALFYDSVVVTEADADRSFYQEVNDRLLEEGRGRGTPNTLFLNANGKDTIHRIVAPLRRLGIPAASVVDVDVLRQGAPQWINHMAAAFVPAGQHQAMNDLRKRAWEKMEEAGKEPKREGGFALLAGEDLEMANNLRNQLAEYGVFIVTIGEIEKWLPALAVPRNKTWLHAIFQAMGNDPAMPNYVRPAADDVWAFLDQIRGWLMNPDRRGIPTH